MDDGHERRTNFIVGRFRTGMSRTTYTILQHFSAWWPCFKRNEVMFCCHTKYYGKVIWSNGQLEWFILFLWKRSEKFHMLYGMQRNPPGHAPFFCPFHFEMVFPSIQPVDILLYIVWLSLIWDTDWLNTVTWSTNISVCCPPQSCGGGTLIDTTHFFTQTNGKLSLRYYRFKHVCWPS